MFRINLLVFLSLFCFSLTSAQQIQSMTLIPTNPTDADFITIDVEAVNFPSGGCTSSAYSCLMTGFRIEGFSFHQLGPLAVICSSTDNFIIGMLQAGTYTYVHELSASTGGSDLDSIQFTVTTTTGVKENGDQSITVFPQPAFDIVNVNLAKNTSGSAMIEIINFLGQRIYFEEHDINAGQFNIDVSAFQSGLYYIVARRHESTLVQKMIVQH